jgi:hypothetical protein
MKRLLVLLLGAALVTLTFARVSASPARAADSLGNPMILAVGDMACDPQDPMFNNGNGTLTNCAEKRVSDAMVNDITNPPLGSSYDAVLGLGDYQYSCGEPLEWAASYNPTYGRLDSRMDPAVGNHEYNTGIDNYGSPCPADNTVAQPYFTHFGAAAHQETNGHYSFDLGSWHLVALNANCSAAKTGGCSATSAQTTWLKADLAKVNSTTQPCIMAFWHQPLWTGTGTGAAKVYRNWWNVLYAAHADVVLNGHIHNYQRFAPMNSQGSSDPATGITEFVVGSGGEAQVAVKAGVVPYPVAKAKAFGYLRMTLQAASWSAAFVQVDGNGATTVSDTSVGACHL